MNLKMLKKDLFKKKSINLILLIFVMLATTFVASGVTNVFKVMNALDDFMEISGLSDYVILTAKKDAEEIDDNNKKIQEFLENEKSVENFVTDEFIIISKRNAELENGKEIELDSTTLISSFDIKQQKFYDKNNEEITDIKDGEIYINRRIYVNNEISVGDKIRIFSDNGYSKEFTVKGYTKDVLVGGDLIGTYRFIVNNNDYAELKENSSLTEGYIYSVDVSNVKEFKKAYNDEDFSALFTAAKSLIKTSYIMNMIIAIVILLVSICLIIISAIMLRFTIIFTINEEYKSIGILKAIGVKDSGIRKLFITKYFVISVVGAAIGFILSIPFGNLLLKQVTDTIVVKNNNEKILLQIILSIFVVLIVTFFTYISTGKIKKFSPMDAIRNGNNGERFNKKGRFALKNKGMRTTTFLAINDVVSEIKKYLVLLIAGVVGIWLVIVPVNTINTLRSEKIGAWIGIADCDLVIDEFIADELVSKSSKQVISDYVNENEKKLNDNGIKTDNVFMEITFKYKIRCNDLSYQSLALQGVGTSTDWYMYDKGTAPKYDNEVAITHIVADEINADVGDTVYITMYNEERPFVVTAIYQSMNNMGEGIRFSDNVELDYSALAGAFALQVDLYGEPNEKEIKNVKEKLYEIYDGKVDVYTVEEYIDIMLGGVSHSLESLKILILVVVIIINILIVVLMQKMFLIRERGEIGMLKAIGYSNRKIIKWQTKRITMVLFVGILLGTVTSTFISEISSGQVFKIMGASKIEFVINPLEVYVIYPVMIFVVTVISCIITMRSVRKVDVKDVNNIE